MLITPLIAGVGGLIAFFAVVFVVVWLPIHTFDPPAVGRLDAALEGGRQGPQPLRLERLLRLPLGVLAARRTSATRLYFLYPKVSQPGDFFGSDQTPEPARDRAHRARPLPGVGLAPGRLAARSLLRPALHRPAFADAVDEVALLRHAGRAARYLRRDAEWQVGAAALCGTVLREAHRAREPGLPAAVHAASRARTSPSSKGTTRFLNPPKGQLEEAPNLSQIDRGYWLSGNPLPVTEQNLLRGKEVFLRPLRRLPRRRRRRQGARARASCRRPRPTSPTRTTPAAAATPAQATSITASCAAGPARRWRTSATA